MRKIVLFLVVIIPVFMATSCMPVSFHKWLAKYNGDVKQEYIVQNARNRILSYDWYYDQKGQIDAQIANLESTPETADEYSGMVRVVNAMIAEYNSRSKQYNHNLWKAKDLPYEIDFYKGVSK